ncbi:hypothetical protein C8R47DRAFT_1113769 [Mycena vitilis]|nr:hypothetical protein C8R47DRAFT_1113769 [Mycena vitilis]
MPALLLLGWSVHHTYSLHWHPGKCIAVALCDRVHAPARPHHYCLCACTLLARCRPCTSLLPTHHYVPRTTMYHRALPRIIHVASRQCAPSRYAGHWAGHRTGWLMSLLHAKLCLCCRHTERRRTRQPVSFSTLRAQPSILLIMRNLCSQLRQQTFSTPCEGLEPSTTKYASEALELIQ